MTRPSQSANETLTPATMLFVPQYSVGMKNPGKGSISKRPGKNHKYYKCKFIKTIVIITQINNNTQIMSQFWKISLHTQSSRTHYYN